MDALKDDTTIAASKLTTCMLFTIEYPALAVNTQISFSVKPSNQRDLLDNIEDMLQTITNEWYDSLIACDKDGTDRKLDFLRKRGTTELEDWQGKMKICDEWKMKVDVAKSQMNKMRDAYYKELFHLREQAYQRKKAEDDGRDFTPSYALHFDPTEYTLEDEVTRLVTDKVALMQQEMTTMVSEIEVKYSTRIHSLTEQLMTCKMQKTRIEKLLAKVRKQHGYEDDAHLEEVVGPVHIKEESMEKLKQRIEDRILKAEKKKKKAADATSKEDDGAAKCRENNSEADNLREFLERKFGSLREARVKMGLRTKLDNTIGVVDFESLTNDIGYACEAKKVFMALAGGSPFVTLASIFERLSDQGGGARRMSAPSKLDGLDKAVASFTSGGAHDPHKRRGSAADAIYQDMTGKKHSNGALTKVSSFLGKIQEGEGGAVSSRKVANEDDDHDGLSDDSGTESVVSDISTSTTTTLTSSTPKASKLRLKKSGTCGSRIADHGGKAPPRRNKPVDQGTATSISYPSGIEAAFSKHQPSSGITTDCGTDALPYEAAFPKIKRLCRGTQSQVDARMLDKAMDFFDQEAENNWNCLAALMTDADDEVEESRAADKTWHSTTSNVKSEPDEEDPAEGATEPTSPGRHETIETSASEPKLVPRRPSAFASDLRKGTCGSERKRSRSQLAFGSGDRFASGSTFADQDFGPLVEFFLDQNLTPARKAARLWRQGAIADAHLLGASMASRRLSQRFFTSSRTVTQEVPKADAEIQCVMNKTYLVQPLEMWLPPEVDPHDVQLQQMLSMASEIADRLPLMWSRAMKLVNEACDGATQEQALADQIARWMGLHSPAQIKAPAERPSFGSRAPSQNDNTLTGMLNRHGVGTGSTMRSTWAGFREEADGTTPSRQQANDLPDYEEDLERRSYQSFQDGVRHSFSTFGSSNFQSAPGQVMRGGMRQRGAASFARSRPQQGLGAGLPDLGDGRISLPSTSDGRMSLPAAMHREPRAPRAMVAASKRHRNLQPLEGGTTPRSPAHPPSATAAATSGPESRPFPDAAELMSADSFGEDPNAQGGANDSFQRPPRRLSDTAKPMAMVDTPRLIADKARRRSLEDRMHQIKQKMGEEEPESHLDEDLASPTSPQEQPGLAPGWSGILQKEQFNSATSVATGGVTDPDDGRGSNKHGGFDDRPTHEAIRRADDDFDEGRESFGRESFGNDIMTERPQSPGSPRSPRLPEDSSSARPDQVCPSGARLPGNPGSPGRERPPVLPGKLETSAVASCQGDDAVTAGEATSTLDVQAKERCSTDVRQAPRRIGSQPFGAASRGPPPLTKVNRPVTQPLVPRGDQALGSEEEDASPAAGSSDKPAIAAPKYSTTNSHPEVTERKSFSTAKTVQMAERMSFNGVSGACPERISLGSRFGPERKTFSGRIGGSDENSPRPSYQMRPGRRRSQCGGVAGSPGSSTDATGASHTSPSGEATLASQVNSLPLIDHGLQVKSPTSPPSTAGPLSARQFTKLRSQLD